MRTQAVMDLQIKSNVTMNVRSPGESIPTIPWGEMFYKDAFDIPVEQDEMRRKLGAVRSAHKRWCKKNPDTDKEFYIGQHYENSGNDMFVRVYCKEGPAREGNQ